MCGVDNESEKGNRDGGQRDQCRRACQQLDAGFTCKPSLCRRRRASGCHRGAAAAALKHAAALFAARLLCHHTPGLATNMASLSAEEAALAAELPPSQWEGLEAWYMDSSDEDQRLPHR